MARSCDSKRRWHHTRQNSPELPQAPGLQACRHLDDPGLHEVKRLSVDEPGDDLELGEVLIDNIDDFDAQSLQVFEIIRIQ